MHARCPFRCLSVFSYYEFFVGCRHATKAHAGRRMSTLVFTFVAALGEAATRRYVIDVNEKCARLREADVEAHARLREADAVAKVRSVALKARLLPLLPVPEQLNVPGSSIVWSAAKIFENVLCFLDVPATDHSLLVTRTYFPWTKDPTSLPARVAAYRTTPHPAAPGSLGLAASSVRSQALQSTPATRGRDAPENHCGLNNKTVLASQEATHGTLKKILRWALHRDNILIDVDMARDLEDPQHRTHRIQVDVAKQLVWWARQVQPIVGRKWESAYRHIVRTDKVPADSSLA